MFDILPLKFVMFESVHIVSCAVLVDGKVYVGLTGKRPVLFSQTSPKLKVL